METADKFKNSPIHDKQAILGIIDELHPEQMGELVSFLQKLTAKPIKQEMFTGYLEAVNFLTGCDSDQIATLSQQFNSKEIIDMANNILNEQRKV